MQASPLPTSNPWGSPAARCHPACCLLELLKKKTESTAESLGVLRFHPSNIDGAAALSLRGGAGPERTELGQPLCKQQSWDGALDLLTPVLLLACNMFIVIK